MREEKFQGIIYLLCSGKLANILTILFCWNLISYPVDNKSLILVSKWKTIKEAFHIFNWVFRNVEFKNDLRLFFALVMHSFLSIESYQLFMMQSKAIKLQAWAGPEVPGGWGSQISRQWKHECGKTFISEGKYCITTNMQYIYIYILIPHSPVVFGLW